MSVHGFTPTSPFSHRVTPHITAGELSLNQEARRFNFQHQCDTAVRLCEFMEPEYHQLELDLRLYLTAQEFEASSP